MGEQGLHGPCPIGAVCEGPFRYFFQCGPANSAICIPDVGVANPDGTIGLVVAGPKAGKVHRLPADPGTEGVSPMARLSDSRQWTPDPQFL